MTTPADPGSQPSDDVDVQPIDTGSRQAETSDVTLTTDDDSQHEELPVKPDNA